MTVMGVPVTHADPMWMRSPPSDNSQSALHTGKQSVADPAKASNCNSFFALTKAWLSQQVSRRTYSCGPIPVVSAIPPSLDIKLDSPLSDFTQSSSVLAVKSPLHHEYLPFLINEDDSLFLRAVVACMHDHPLGAVRKRLSSIMLRSIRSWPQCPLL